MSRAPYPHCDSLVLHAPGTCRYCDQYPDKQSRRVMAGIAFTNESDLGPLDYTHHLVSDPAQLLRPRETIEQWPGNRPVGYVFPDTPVVPVDDFVCDDREVAKVYATWLESPWFWIVCAAISAAIYIWTK